MLQTIIHFTKKLATMPFFKDILSALVNFFTQGSKKKAQKFAQQTTEQFAESLPSLIDELAQFFQSLHKSNDPTAAVIQFAQALLDKESAVNRLVFSSKQAYDCYTLLNEDKDATPAQEMTCFKKITA